MRKINLVIIIIFTCLISYNACKDKEYNISYKNYYKNNKMEEETVFKNKVKTIYDEYTKNGSILKPSYIGAIYSVSYDASGMSYKDYTDDMIRDLFKYMNTDPNVADDAVLVYNEDAFKEHLKDLWFTSNYFTNSKLTDDERTKLVNKIFDFDEFYYELYYGERPTDGSGCGSFSGIKVNVLDAKSGNIQKTLSLDEYMLGVAYGEEDSHITNNPEFGKAFFISAIMFTLNRAGYTSNKDMTEFSIENSTNVQVWCDPTTGCGTYDARNNALYIDAKGSYKKALSAEKLAKYKEIYNSVAGTALQTSNGKLNNDVHYVADMKTCNDNKEWCKYGVNTMITQDAYQMAQSGATYKEVLSKYFSTSSVSNVGGTNSCSMSGWTLRTKAPLNQSLGYNQYYGTPTTQAYYGECVWYVRGRGQEIAAELMQKGILDKTVGNTIINRLEGVYGNAIDWFDAAKGKFKESTNYKQYKAGSIVVYGGGVKRCNGPCGHVAVIENVDQTNKTITYTEGGKTYESSGYFNTRTFTFDEFEAYILGKTGSSLTFKGYIYFLEPTS